jgi:hypothetical protein
VSSGLEPLVPSENRVFSLPANESPRTGSWAPGPKGWSWSSVSAPEVVPSIPWRHSGWLPPRTGLFRLWF